MGLRSWLGRVLMSTWFREVDIVDAENVPSDRGSIIVSWHPGGIFDRMLLNANIKGQVPFDGLIDDRAELEMVAKSVAVGGNVVVFPEGDAHDNPRVEQIRACSARLAMRAREISPDNPPVIVPLGIHYSEKHQFRERVALVFDRPVEVRENDTVEGLTDLIKAEMNRASHSRSNWEDRKLIWKARGIIHAERVRRNPELKVRQSYGESVLGARRVRAAWEWLATEKPEKCKDIENDIRGHLSRIESLGLHPTDLDSKPESVSTKGFLTSIWWWGFAWSFMLGFVTWSAIIGSLIPYLCVILADRVVFKKLKNESRRGAMKLYTAMAFYPLWWLFAAWIMTWFITNDASPLNYFSDFGVILPFLFSLPVWFIYPLMLWWLPIAARLQLKLYARGVRAWRELSMWKRWRQSDFDWDRLCASQKVIATRLVAIGDGLILPGDKEWTEPSIGIDDHEVILLRKTSN